MGAGFAFADIVACANDIVIVTTADHAAADGPKIVYVNHAFTRLTGYSPEEVIGKTPSILQGSATSAETRARIRQALDLGQSIQVEILNYGKSGQEYWLDLNIVPLRDGQGIITHFVAIERNITEKKRAQQLLTENERFLDAVIENIPNMIFVKDAENLRFFRFNRAGETLLGMSRQELLGKSDYDFFPKSEADFFVTKDREVLDSGELLDIPEEEIQTANGKRFLHTKKIPIKDQSGRPRYLLGISEDITERKQAEQARRESEQRYQTLFNGMLEGVVMQDRSGSMISHNPAAQRILGLSADQLEGYSSLDPRWQAIRETGEPFPGDQHPSMVCLRTGEPCRDIVMGLRRSDDSVTWIQISSEPLYKDNDSKPFAVVSTFHDITARQQIDQMKNEFISVVSHELRTPLTSIRGALGLLHGGAIAGLPSQAHHLVDIAMRNCDRLLSLINDLLDMEKIASGKSKLLRETIPLAELVTTALQVNQPYGEKYHVRFVSKELAPELSVSVDRMRMLQVLANLLSNAAKFSPVGGIVEVAVGKVESNWGRITVSDQGPGVPEDFRDHIFGKFAQADSSSTREQGGTGLGLAISRALVTQHGGHIGFYDNEPQGTVFYVDLPLVSS